MVQGQFRGGVEEKIRLGWTLQAGTWEKGFSECEPRLPVSESPRVFVEIQVPGPHFRPAGPHRNGPGNRHVHQAPQCTVCGPTAPPSSGSGLERQNPRPHRRRKQNPQLDKIPGDLQIC